MRSDAGGSRVGGEHRAAERVRAGLGSRYFARLARARKRQARRNSGQVPVRKTGLLQAFLGGLKDGCKTVINPKPNIGGTRNGFAQFDPIERTQASTAVASAAIHAE
jgi:hypothetical protein